MESLGGREEIDRLAMGLIMIALGIFMLSGIVESLESLIFPVRIIKEKARAGILALWLESLRIQPMVMVPTSHRKVGHGILIDLNDIRYIPELKISSRDSPD